MDIIWFMPSPGRLRLSNHAHRELLTMNVTFVGYSVRYVLLERKLYAMFAGIKLMY